MQLLLLISDKSWIVARHYPTLTDIQATELSIVKIRPMHSHAPFAQGKLEQP